MNDEEVDGAVAAVVMAVGQIIVHLQQNILPALVSDDSSSSIDEYDYPQPPKRRRKSSDMPRIRNCIPLVVKNFADNKFQSHFRLSRGAYNWLLANVAHRIINQDVGHPSIDVEKQFLSVLWILATPDSFRSVASRFGMSKGSLHICFQRVIKALNWLCPQVVKWPDKDKRMRIRGSYTQLGGIDGVVGAIDGTYVRIKAPTKNPEYYINRNFFYGITLQGICDDGRKFIDAFAGYPSSVSDIRIFRNSPIYQSFMGQPESYFFAERIYHRRQSL